MERYTERTQDKTVVREGRLEEALERLAVFEDMFEGLERDQVYITRQLEELRSRGKEKTVQFRELLARKLVNGNMKLLLERYGIR